MGQLFFYAVVQLYHLFEKGIMRKNLLYINDLKSIYGLKTLPENKKLKLKLKTMVCTKNGSIINVVIVKNYSDIHYKAYFYADRV